MIAVDEHLTKCIQSVLLPFRNKQYNYVLHIFGGREQKGKKDQFIIKSSLLQKRIKIINLFETDLEQIYFRQISPKKSTKEDKQERCHGYTKLKMISHSLFRKKKLK